MKKIKLFSLALTMLQGLLTFGQEKTITRVVSDGQEILPFANIHVKTKKQVTQTDSNGQFTIKAKPGDKLLISYLGFDTFELEIGEKITQYYITLKSNAMLLQEVYDDPIPQKKL